MLQMTLHLIRSSRLWTFQLLGREMFQVRLQKSHFNRFYREYINQILDTSSRFILQATNETTVQFCVRCNLLTIRSTSGLTVKPH
jgi:hypothetical protein